MKQLPFIIILCLILCGQVQAQRYLPGQKGIQATAAFVDGFGDSNKQAFCIGIALSNYTKNRNHKVFGIEYLQKQYDYKEISIPVSQFTAEGEYYVRFLSDPSKTVFLSLGASLMTGYETVNWGKSLLYDGARIEAKDKFLYGGALSFEMETFLSDRIILLLNIRERYLPPSSVQDFHFQAGIGIKCIIN